MSKVNPGFTFPFDHLNLKEVAEWERLSAKSVLTHGEATKLGMLNSRKIYIPREDDAPRRA